MTIIILLIAISLSIALLFLGIFYWNMRSGQYDDTYTPSVRMLFDSKPGKGTAARKDEPPVHDVPDKEVKRVTHSLPDHAQGIG